MMAAGPAKAAPVTGRLLLAYHACDVAPCNDPRQHKVYVASSGGGRRFEVVDGWEPYAGSVPDIIRRGDTLYVYTTTQVRRGLRVGDHWLAPEALLLVDEQGNRVQGVDLSAIVVDGALVLYFLEGQVGSDPARCPVGSESCTRRFRMAVEEPGSDGTRFRVRSEPVLEVTIKGQNDSASDPDIFPLWGGGYGLLVSRGMSFDAFVAESPDGPWTARGSQVRQGGGGVPSGIATRWGYWAYVSARDRDTGIDGIRRARFREFGAGIDEASFRWIYPGVWGRASVSSPSIALNQPGSPAKTSP